MRVLRRTRRRRNAASCDGRVSGAARRWHAGGASPTMTGPEGAVRCAVVVLPLDFVC